MKWDLAIAAVGHPIEAIERRVTRAARPGS
jgi:hypothetical protein